jgi:hypothetical protein
MLDCCSKLELDWLKLELEACWLMELLCMLDCWTAELLDCWKDCCIDFCCVLC